jgi:TRAP transporter TAXI family solute receptor
VVPPAQSVVRISTGFPDMTFKPLGDALVKEYARVLPDVRFEVEETAGSVTNIEDLQNGTADLGLALADVAYMAFSGDLRELVPDGRNVRGLAVLHSSRVHVMVRANSNIKSVVDFRGHRVVVGPPGSGTAVTSSMLLQAFAVPLEQVEQRALSFASATDALIRGDLEGLFVVSADPTETVDRAIRAGARLLDVSGPTITRLRADYPFLRNAVIPAHTYPGQPHSVETVAIDVLLLCRAGLPEPFVHRLTWALFQVLPSLAKRFDYLKLMELNRAPATPVPLHPGAAWYYRQEELLQ